MVVADNAEDARSASAFLPDGEGGQILVTSRSRDWGGTVQVIEVDVVGEDEAAEYLLRATGETDRAEALSLARALGCLPLALEKAAAYLAQSPGLSLGGYLAMFRGRAEQVDDHSRPRSYPTSVAVTCTLAVDRVVDVSPVAVTLLRACAFLAPEDVPLSLLSGVDELPEPLDAGPLTQRDALAALSRMGLARSTWAGGIAVDQVVQAVVRDHLTGDGRRSWAAGVVRLVERAFSPDSLDVAGWDRCGRLVPHALAVTAHGEAADLEPQATSRLLARVGLYLQGRGQYDEARGLLERALAITEIAYGPDCFEAAAQLANLAAVLQDMGRFGDARVCLERALAVVETTHGDAHPAVATLAGNLGSLLTQLGEPTQARLCLERALAVDETLLGPDHPDVATDLSNLAVLLWSGGDTLEARRCFDEALSIDEATHGADDPVVARDLANLALVLAELGDLGEARRGLERALAIVESAFGPGHPEVATHLNNLAMVLQDSGRFADARVCLERALAIAEDHDGPRHPTVAGVLNNLATVLSQLGEATVARLCLDRALAIDEAALGPDHAEVVGIRNNRARLLREPGPGPQAG